MNTIHAVAPSMAEGEATATAEVSLDMMTTGSPIGIGIGITQGGTKTIMAQDEVVAVDPIMVDSTVVGMVVTIAHLKIVMCCPASTSILGLLVLGLVR